MAERRDHDETTDEGRARFARDVHDALLSAGWAIPESEADVRRAEEALADGPAALPESLCDPAAAWRRAERTDAPGVRIAPFPSAGEAAENLARAARDGGEIPPEIEEILRRDRRAAEEELDRNEHGEDVG